MGVLSKALTYAAIISFIAGCAVGSGSVNPDDSTAPGTDAVAADQSIIEGELVPTAGNTGRVVESQQIASAADNGLGINLERGTAFTRVVLDAGSDDPVFEVLSIGNPPRLVVDLLGEQGSSNDSFFVDGDSYVKSIRLGAHRDKTRIVFDLTDRAADNAVVDQKIDTEGGRLVVAFVEDGVVPAEIAAEPISEETTEVVAADTSADQVILDSLNFVENGAAAGQVAITLTDAVPYELRQTTPTEYVLTLPGVSPAKRTLVPQIAPQGTGGIRSVRATAEEDVTQVRMFVDSGATLIAKPRGSTILISERDTARAQLTPEDEIPAIDARAQMADEEAEEEEEFEEEEDDLGGFGRKKYTGRLISLDLQDTDIDNALRIIAEVSNLNIIASDDVTGKVTLRLIDVPWDQALDVILKTNGLDKVQEGNVVRIAPVEKLRAEREALKDAKRAKRELEDLTVNYIRVSYARVTDIQEQVESVLSERGSVTVDSRTNQLIVKDIEEGHEDVLELVRRLDLRTPQVLLETQIVEGQRNILRDLGFQWNFDYRQTPETGNATGFNFPNSVTIGGDNAGNAVDFPAANAVAGEGSAISLLLDSADGGRLLSARLSALERTGNAKIISRPQVATVNNETAEIKSVEKVRVRLPDSGTSVATGSGASASGGGSSAFEEINVGIELRMTPQASPDYYVLLDIWAKSSTFGGRNVDNIPSTIEREATSTVLVKSGSTFALGGVYRIQDTDRVSGVPFLKDIPVFGHAFRRSLVDNNDEELIFFITPHIVEGSFDPSLM